jgi:hypothetical protein
MTVGIDTYLKALIKTQISIDSASRVFLGREPLEIHVIGGVRKVQLPNSKQLISLDDLVVYGAKVLGGRTPRTLALYGAEARWEERIKARTEAGLPSNVYIANARSISYAQEKGRIPPSPTYIGRRQNKMTEVFDTVEEVVQAMNNGAWRTEFRRGRNSKQDKRARGLGE